MRCVDFLTQRSFVNQNTAFGRAAVERLAPILNQTM